MSVIDFRGQEEVLYTPLVEIGLAQLGNLWDRDNQVDLIGSGNPPQPSVSP